MQESVTCTCTKCSHDFRVNARLLGRELTCPNCGEAVVVEDRSEKLVDFPQLLPEVSPLREATIPPPASNAVAEANLAYPPPRTGNLEKTVAVKSADSAAGANIIS